MKINLKIERPYVHGSVQLSWVEPEPRVRVFSDALTVNGVPVIIEGVLVREGDVWRFASFAVQRATPKIDGHMSGREGGGIKTSRRNQERAREVILDVVSQWAGTPPPKPQPPRVAAESDDGVLADLLA